MSDSTSLHQPGAADAPGKMTFFLKQEHHPQHGTSLGFWIYLMSDCLIFAILFAVHAVLGRNYAAGPSGADLFNLQLIAWATAMLLLSSLTFGFAMIEAQRKRLRAAQRWLIVTGLFGLAFLGLEVYEFAHLIEVGAVPQRSAFLSSFFTLVGTHGLHVAFGVIWLVTLLVQLNKYGLNVANRRRLMCLSMFWHFLDLIWIAVFTFVYLMGVMP